MKGVFGCERNNGGTEQANTRDDGGIGETEKRGGGDEQ